MKDCHEAHVYIPNSIWKRLVKLAEANRRTLNAEIVIAVEKRLERLAAEKAYARRKRR